MISVKTILGVGVAGFVAIQFIRPAIPHRPQIVRRSSRVHDPGQQCSRVRPGIPDPNARTPDSRSSIS